MSTWVRSLPFALDPLIAEAKRRARRRRLVGAVLLLMLIGGALGTATALTGTMSWAHGSALVLAKAQLPPLSNLAARAKWCGDPGNASGQGGCHSPDGKWSVIDSSEGRGCTLTLIRIGTSRRERIGQPGSGSCSPELWARHAFLTQEGFDEPNGRVVRLDPPSRRVKVLAQFRSFVVSPNEHWIAGEGELRRDGTPQLIAVVSLASDTCRVVKQTRDPNLGVSVDKSPWSISPYPAVPPRSFRNPVVWRNGRHGGKKIRIVSGPGTGFTRNSRSVIIGEWERSNAAPYAIHKRLLKFALSSLRTPCPADLAPSS